MEKINLITYNSPRSPIAESYRTLRTNIQFSSFDSKVKVIVITSSGPGEGKSTTSSNLAVTMAQGGHKTLLIDCDLIKSKLHKNFNLSNQSGLTDILVDGANLEEGMQETKIENLFVLTSGTKPPNPAELLASEKMSSFIQEMRNNFEYIIIDTPPIIMVTYAQILSQYADGVLLGVASGEAEREGVLRSKEFFQKVDAKILGYLELY